MPNLGIAKLRTEQRAGKTVVVDQYSQAPLQLHKPLSLSQTAPPVVYLKTPSSGLLAGDEHLIEIEVSKDSSIEMRTQACTLVYPGRSRQIIKLTVADGGKLVFHPHSLILASGCELTQRVSIYLSRGAALDYQEEWCAGRIAMGEQWQFESFDYRLEIFLQGKLNYRERWRMEPSKRPLKSAVICDDFTHFRTRFVFEPPDSQGEIVDVAFPPALRSKSWTMSRESGQVMRTVYC